MDGTGNSKEDFIPFLKWALPKMRMQWKGFRKVQNQAIKRIRKRMKELEINSPEEYRTYLEGHEFEWSILDHLCQITISRFYRDKGMQEKLRREVLPDLASQAIGKARKLLIWSVGSAGGEEAYTMSLMLHLDILPEYSGLQYSIEGIEVNPKLIRRAKKGGYEKSSIRELPEEWLAEAFELSGTSYCLKDPYKTNVFFHQGDIRNHGFSAHFDLVLCRYLIATYYDENLQKFLFERIVGQINSGGYLVLGSNEKLPAEMEGMHLVSRGIYMKI